MKEDKGKEPMIKLNFAGIRTRQTGRAWIISMIF